MKSRATALLVLFLLPVACTDIFMASDPQADWLLLESDAIILHYRPPAWSAAPSPTPGEAQAILEHQTLYHRAIQDSINRTYNDRVSIYLFNEDEAELHTGAPRGGHAIPKLHAIYVSFFHHERNYTDKYGVKGPYIGAHELVHVITHQTLGYAGTKLMSEGYANWLDGSYARYDIGDIIRAFRRDHPERLMTPEELLYDTGREDFIYYPNAGVFTSFLVRTYGVELVNRLFTSHKDAFTTDLEYLAGDAWNEMNDRYARYISSL